MVIVINFPNMICPKCKSVSQYAVMRGNRYGIYCNDYGHFIKWADKEQTAVIKARRSWLERHYEEIKKNERITITTI